MPVLIFESGPDKGKTIRLEEDRVYTLGRDERAEIRIDLELVSRAHAKLRGKDGRFYLKDHESSNGTFVNDARIDGVHELSSGDRIGVGTVVLSYLSDSDAGGAAGRTLGGFQLLQRLGRGGMGTVYRALQKSLNREVALKILAPELARDQKFVEQFLKEARACGQLNHPNIVQVYDVETDAGLVFYAMELMKGGTVEDRINRADKDGPIPIDLALTWMLDAARGLQFAELKRIVHRDIKPDNLMLTELGAVKIADLGLALSAHEGHGDVGILGTPHFISPEQARGEKLDTRSDLYSLGATSFRMLTGRTLFSGESAQEILRKQLKDPAPSVRSLRADCPEKVSAIVAKLLQKDPAQRYQSPAELIEAIEDARTKQSRAAVAALVLVMLLALTGGVGWYLGWFGGAGNTQIVQQVVVNEADKERAREAEARARKAEREARALEAFGALAQQRVSLTDEDYVARLKELVAAHPDTDVSGRAAAEIETLEEQIRTRIAAEASRAQNLEAATARLEAGVAVPLGGRRFADAYSALTRADYGDPETLASEDFLAARRAAREKIDAALAGAEAEFRRALDEAIAGHDFAAARRAIDDAASAFAAPAEFSEADADAAARLAQLATESTAARERVEIAEREWIASTRAADSRAILAAVDWRETFAEIRDWRVVARTALDALPNALATDSYRAFASRLIADLAAFDRTIAATREAIGRGGLANPKVKHPEREGPAEILGLANDGASVTLQVSRGAARSSAPVAFSAFATPAAFCDLVSGRIAETPQAAADAVRATLVFAAARLAPIVERVREQFASFDPATGWTAAQRAALAGIAVPVLDAATLEPWLAAVESDPASGQLGAQLRGRVAREIRALELLAGALAPFAAENSTVRFGLAADQSQVVVDELRDTLAFFAAYPIFDDGSRRLELVPSP